MSNKQIVKNLMSETESIFGRIKNKIDSRTRSAIITKLGITTHLASVKKLNTELINLEKAVQIKTTKPVSVKSIKQPNKIIRVMKPITPVIKKYFVSGNVEIQTNYTYETKKRGQQRSKDYIEIKPDAKVIEAFNVKEANQKFLNKIQDEYTIGLGTLNYSSKDGEGSEEYMVKKVNDIKKY